MAPPVIEFHLEEVPPEYHRCFKEVILSEEFQEADSLRDQCGIICYNLRDIRPNEEITYEVIGNFMDISKADVAYHEQNYKKPKKLNGRPTCLSEDEIADICFFIQNCYYDEQYPTYDEIRNYISDKFGKDLKPDTLRHLIRSLDDCKPVDAVPLDDMRLMCDPDLLKEYYESLKIYIKGVPNHFIINVDECGYQPFMDAKKQRVVVPITHEGTVYYGANKTTKRNTMIAGIFADGSSLKPYIVTNRKTIDNELLLLGYGDDSVCFGSTANGFINSACFNEWANAVLFPEIRSRRVRYNYKRTLNRAVIILDGCSCHCNDDFLNECIYQNVIPIFLAPHSSDQAQMLDLGIFGVQKMHIPKIKPDKNLSDLTKQVVKIVDSWRAAATPRNITQAFKAAGLDFYLENGEILCRVNLYNAVKLRSIDPNCIVDESDPIQRRRRLAINIF